MNKENITPKWLKLRDAEKYSGLSTRSLHYFIADNLIVSSLVKKRGNERGQRLIDVASLDAFIKAGIGKRTDLKMNNPKS